MVITARTALFLWLLGITTSVSMTFGLCYLRLHPAPPEPPPPCRNRAETACCSAVVTCDPGQRLEVYPSGGYNLYKCLCPEARLPPPGRDAAAGGPP